jgi:hypothetical protein
VQRTHAKGGPAAAHLAKPALAAGPRWALAGLARVGGWAGVDWVGPSGSAQVGKDRFCFFLKYIFSAKEFHRNPSNSFKALKILRKSQKFQENS